jgi:hypothetical protein
MSRISRGGEKEPTQHPFFKKNIYICNLKTATSRDRKWPLTNHEIACFWEPHESTPIGSDVKQKKKSSDKNSHNCSSRGQEAEKLKTFQPCTVISALADGPFVKRRPVSVCITSGEKNSEEPTTEPVG